MFYSPWWLFLGLGIGISESLRIDNQMIFDIVDFYSVTLLTVVYEEGYEHDLDYNLCQSGVVLCLGYSEQSLEEINNSLEVAIQNGDMKELFFIGTNNAELLRSLKHKIFTKGQVIFMHVNESDEVDGQGNLKIDNNIIFYGASSMENEIYMREKYRIGFAKEHGVITRLLGTWSTDSGLRVTKSPLWERRSDLSGVNLRTGILRWSPYANYIWDKDRKKLIGIKGYMGDIFSTLQSKLNFTHTLSIPEDGMFGTASRHNGSVVWNGLVGMLIRDEIDIQVTGLSWFRGRDMVMDYIMPVLSDRTVLIARVSHAQEVNVWVYLHIFTYDVWSTIILTLIVFSCYLFILHIIRHEAFVEQSIREGLLLFISAPVRQLIQIPYDLNPMHLSSKISIIAFAVGLYVLFAHYTCNLTASMVTTPQKVGIRSLDDATRLGYKIGVVEGSGSAGFLRKFMKGTEVNVEWLKSEESHYTSLLSHYLETEPNALIYSDYLSSLEIDGIYPIDIKETYKTVVGFSLQKNSPYSQLFNYHLQNMDEKGIIQRLQKKRIPKRDGTSKIDFPLSLGYNNLLFPFLVLISGCSVALVMASFERIIKPPNLEDNAVEIDNVTLMMRTDQAEDCKENALLAAKKRILELEMDRDKLQAEVWELRDKH